MMNITTKFIKTKLDGSRDSSISGNLRTKLTLNININNDDYLLRLLLGTRRGQKEAAASLLKFSRSRFD